MSCVTSVYAVVAVCVYLHFELFVGLNHRFTEFGSIPIVYIVIGCAMHEQKIPTKIIHSVDGIYGIAVGVLFRSAHVAFGVDGVVILPVRRRSYSDAGFEYFTPFAHAH